MKHLSVEELVKAFEQAHTEPLRARSAEVGRLIRAEDGVGLAVEIIERRGRGGVPAV